MRANDLTGKRFGKWTVIERVPNVGMSKWLCRCDCGTTREILGGNLTSGKSTTCGCWRDNHGGTNSILYNRYQQMRHSDGVEWTGFDDFRRWAFENGYEDDKGCRFTRLDCSKPFGPDNCVVKR